MDRLRHVVEAQQFSWEFLQELSALTDAIKGNPKAYAEKLKGLIISLLFYEASTRTRSSFHAAALRLGAGVITTENARLFSSALKGETLEDTVRVMSGYADLIVLRFDKTGGAAVAAQCSRVPVINAGDGTGQHPTQALLDLYTILERKPDLHGQTIALVGDLGNGRTVHSLAYLLAKHYSDNRLVLLSPTIPQVMMPAEILGYLDRKRVLWTACDQWESVLEQADIVYMTRVQQERFEKEPELYQEVCRQAERLHLTLERVRQMKSSAIILHPLPRLAEIPSEIDADPRAQYFPQSDNGMFTRMALLLKLLGKA